MPRRFGLAVAAILTAAAALRLWTIGDGLPYVAATDEWRLTERALAIMRSGVWHPQAFDLGSLTVYLHVAVSSARFLVGSTEGEWSKFAHLWDGPFVLWTRVVTTAAGVAAVYVAMRIGSRWNARAALVTGALLAVAPALVAESQVARAGTWLLLLLLLTVLLSIRAAESGRQVAMALAGFTAGLAASTSLSGLLAWLIPVSVAVTWPRGRRLATGGLAAGAAAAGFLATSPYVLLDLPAFLNSAAAMLHESAGRTAWSGVRAAGGTVLAALSLAPGSWDPARITSCLGAFAGAVGLLRAAKDISLPERRAAAISLIALALVVSWAATRWGVGGGSAASLVAVSLLFVALGIARLAGWIGAPERRARLRSVALAAVVLLIVSTAGRSLAQGAARTRLGPAEQLASWLLTHVSEREPVVVESYAVRLPLSIRSTSVARLIDRPVDGYRADGATYLVARMDVADAYLHDPRRFPEEAAAYQALLASVEVAARFAGENGRGPAFAVLRVTR
jgi:hypothetical protein